MGYIVPGPGAREARTQGARKSLGSRVEVFWPFFFIMRLNFSEDLFFLVFGGSASTFVPPRKISLRRPGCT